jgi:hypothetical protein
VRISVLLFVLLFARAAFAADEGGSIGRMDFADTPEFHSVFERRVPPPPAPRGVSGVSAKMRIAMWASGSTLPSRPETLDAIQPSALAIVHALQPSETVTAKTVMSASIEESPPHQLVRRERFKRHVFLPETDEDQPSFLEYQRHALSNRADLDAESVGEDAQPSFLGRPAQKNQSDGGDDAQPSLLGRIFDALFPG